MFKTYAPARPPAASLLIAHSATSLPARTIRQPPSIGVRTPPPPSFLIVFSTRDSETPRYKIAYRNEVFFPETKAFSSETKSFSSETEAFSSETKSFSLENESFSSEKNLF
ncbi:MAG: hypothetical protein LBF83_07575 [Spirochaetaceae bacterium]|nr:hypothetical protein [Spirochaetaceae bacterium]